MRAPGTDAYTVRKCFELLKAFIAHSNISDGSRVASCNELGGLGVRSTGST